MTANLILESCVLFSVLLLVYYMKKKNHKHILAKISTMFIGVLFFQIMSEPMWRNNSLHWWAYLFNDVSWIITLGWVVIFFVSMLIVDYKYSSYSEKKKFWLYTLVITIITAPIEILLFESGIRGYSSELTNTMTGIFVPLTNAPIEIIFIIPIIVALILPFYKVTLDLVLSKNN